ncbi:hypothetical protein [Achromobacter marplatensis]|uniref:aromatic-ring hydroxylase C-terminal domain-containing protein n=1 Tax=Achromobacter marplatensis TaxID=470868 RepID=UPI0036F2B5BF
MRSHDEHRALSQRPVVRRRGCLLEKRFRDLVGTRDGATYFAERVWGVSQRYDLSSSHPLVGRSMPDFELADGTRASTLLRQGKGLFLDFAPDAAVDASWDALTRRWREQVNYVAGDARERLGLRAVLVRPDGIVAWATDSYPDETRAVQALSRWFGGA